MRPTPVICGPTASGKSAVALALAERLTRLGHRPHIVSADAFQVYTGLDIASAKPAQAERHALPHHLIDIVAPEDRFTVADWLGRARDAIDQIRAQGGLPLVVGGTHLYIKALLDGLFQGPPPDPALRAELDATPQPLRRAMLERDDPHAAARIHPNDQRRTIRALEIFRQTGIPISRHQQQWDAPPADSPYRLFILSRETADLNSRINARVREMVQQGLLAETRALAPRLGPTARQALGTSQMLEHLAGRCTLEEAAERIKIETRRFAKNQRTWMRRLSATPGAIAVDLTGREVAEAADEIAAQFAAQIAD